jgi:hypothetical protein
MKSSSNLIAEALKDEIANWEWMLKTGENAPLLRLNSTAEDRRQLLKGLNSTAEDHLRVLKRLEKKRQSIEGVCQTVADLARKHNRAAVTPSQFITAVVLARLNAQGMIEDARTDGIVAFSAKFRKGLVDKLKACKSAGEALVVWEEAAPQLRKISFFEERHASFKDVVPRNKKYKDRKGKKHKGSPELTLFMREMSSFFQERAGQPCHGEVATVAEVVFGIDVTIDMVRAALRQTTQEGRRPKQK